MGLTDYSRMDKEFFASGVKAEQERIIKLLEQQFAYSYWSDLSPEFLIALIKGEN